MSKTTTPHPPTGPPGSPSTSPGLRTVDSAEILRGSQEVSITHNGRLYRLRKTRNGKLILT